MFVIPTRMLLGIPVSLSRWWVWNHIPLTPGDLEGGLMFAGLAPCENYARKPAGTVREGA